MAPIGSSRNFVAYQLAREFKHEVYRLTRMAAVAVDLKFRAQLFDAASGIEANLAEGFRRGGHGEFAQFTRYAAGSLAETRVRLEDGIDRGYFSHADALAAMALAKRCDDAVAALERSLAPPLDGGAHPRASGRRTAQRGVPGNRSVRR